jgi:catechol 2,3-dioxygenase-like lactoylglutathione lyase family enzyme
MFSHIIIGSNDLARSKIFYDAILGVLGAPPPREEENRMFYMTSKGILGITKPINGEPATPANGFTLGFAAESPEIADAWHAAGLKAGGVTCEDPPGVREGAMGKLYLAYLRDPDGNKLCALHRM